MIKPDRLLSLDVMRGITIAAMILVNNPAVWGNAYAPLQHAPWHGMTPTDLIYPFFVFIMGVSGYFSLARRHEGGSRAAVGRIVRRSAVIFALGLLLQTISYVGYGTSRYLLGQLAEGTSYWQAVFPAATFRILGVLQGLALAYLFGALALLALKFRHLLAAACGLLLLYWGVLLIGNGFSLSADNILAIADRAVLGESHLYVEHLQDGSLLAFEPEGLLSTLPRIAQFLLGAAVGRILRSQEERREQLNRLFVLGVGLLFAGLLLQYGCPLNKKIWSSSFALASSGFGTLLLGLLVRVIDIGGHTRWTGFFRVFGINPLLLYMAAWTLSVAVGFSFRTASGVTSVKGWIYSRLIDPFCGDAFGSLVYSLLFVGAIWALGYRLYRKNICIKI